MAKFILSPLSAIITILLLDFIWLGFVGKNLYKTEIGHLLKENPLGSVEGIAAALVVYATISLGICFFILPQSSSVLSALTRGALFGFIAYAIYDFTNLCTLTGWTLKISVIDTLWGTFLCGVSSATCFFISQKMS